MTCQNRKLIKSNRGFTLVELLVVLAILLVAMSLSTSLIFFSTKAHESTFDEYQLQAKMRTASEKTNTAVRYSSAVFTIPEGRFFEANLTAGWNYLGVSSDKKEIIRYVYEERGGITKHWKEVIVPDQQNLEFDLTFQKVNADPNDKILKFKLVGTVLGDNSRKITIETDIDALNALQIVDRGTISNPAVAIAYRSDERPEEEIVGDITIVVDTSGSMAYDLNGNQTGVPTSEMRITKLKNALVGYTKPSGEIVEGMINSFSREENVEICLVPFSRSANYPTPTSEFSSQTHPFYRVSLGSEKSQLIDLINDLNASGGTNTGDGMRRAYYRNKWFHDNVTTMSEYGSQFTSRDYMIILVDGVTTMATSVGGTGDSRYRVNDGYQSNLTWWNNSWDWDEAGIIGGGNYENYVTDRYVELIGSYIKNANIKVFVIGFSSLESELNSVNNIAIAAGAESGDIYRFTDSLDIDIVLDEIKSEIMRDLWFIRGPSL